MEIVVLLVVLIVAALVWRVISTPRHVLPIKGKVIYADSRSNVTTFRSYRYRIKSRPDYIVAMPDGNYAILEYKSRLRGIFRGDVQQLIAGAIAVKESCPKKNFTVGMVFNASGETQTIDLRPSVANLAKSIDKGMGVARQVRSRQAIRHQSEAGKCRPCGHRVSCQHRV